MWQFEGNSQHMPVSTDIFPLSLKNSLSIGQIWCPCSNSGLPFANIRNRDHREDCLNFTGQLSLPRGHNTYNMYRPEYPLLPRLLFVLWGTECSFRLLASFLVPRLPTIHTALSRFLEHKFWWLNILLGHKFIHSCCTAFFESEVICFVLFLGGGGGTLCAD